MKWMGHINSTFGGRVLPIYPVSKMAAIHR